MNGTHRKASEQHQPIQMGSKVKDITFGYEGTVKGICLNYWKVHNKPAVEARLWLSMQDHPFTDEQINNERWFRISIVGGGVVLTCQSRLILLSPPLVAADEETAPTKPWSVWARVAATESLTGDYCLYLEDRVESWRGELPVLFVDSGRFKPKTGDLIEGDDKQMIVYSRKKTYHFARSGDSLHFVSQGRLA